MKTEAVPPHRSAASRSRNISALEKTVLFHTGGALLLASWYFGGGSERARWLLSCWGSLGFFLLPLGLLPRSRRPTGPRVPWFWLWPFATLNGLVIASCFNPSFTEKILAGESLLAQTGAAHPMLPSTAHVTTSLQHLWLFDVLYLTAFNLTLITRRRALRGLLLFAGANAVVLSVFGTLQKLVSDGLFFGAFPSPNVRFFATFVYANHWAAFAVLLATASSGLLFRQVYRHDGSPRAQGHLTLGVFGLLLIAITPLIAGSRAGTLMMLVVLAGLAARYVHATIQRRHGPYGSRVIPALAIVAGAILTIAAALWLGRDAVRERLHDTRSQLQGDALADRRELYLDTWKLVTEQPVFGWGLGTYSKVFQLIRPRPLEPNRQYERSYADAHCDWLQAAAEVGLVGAGLFALCALLPIASLRSADFESPTLLHPLLGCALIAAYALVEFPFGNPAVVLTWWFCFFGAVQYGRLSSRERADEFHAADGAS